MQTLDTEVGAGELHALARDPIDIGRQDLPAETSQSVEVLIVRENEDDVGSLRLGGNGPGSEDGGQRRGNPSKAAPRGRGKAAER